MIILYPKDAFTMKKFLPLALFVLVFTGVISTQLIMQKIEAKDTDKKDSTFARYEELFLRGSYQTIDGKKIENSKQKSPVVIVNFWATWCTPCMQEMPSLIELKKKFKNEELQVLAFNTDEEDQMKNIQKAKAKLKLHDEINIIADKNTKIAESFNLSAIPVTIIFNRGKVVHFSNGPMDFASVELVEKIKKWVAN
jgi:thiol-disulfide isomerase/thioredoxin